MNQRFLCGVLFFAVGCSGSSDSGNQPEGAAAAAGTQGNGGSGQAGTSGTSTAGGQNGNGGGKGNGGNAANGGSSSGNGGNTAKGGSGANGGSGNAGANNGGASNGGATGNGGAAGGGTGGAGTGGTPDTSQSVLERNKHPNRDGFFIQPMLTTDAAAKLSRDTAFAPKFSNQMWASPLYLEQGPNGKGVFFAVTTGNDVLALDETTGATVWTKNIGSSPTSSGAGCGSIHPIGILSTPVIDAKTRTIYVAGAIGTASIMSHEVHALSVDDGTEKPGFPVTISGKSGSTTFTPPPQNQRSALSLVNGTLYVAYGGHVGDCGTYHGWVFGIDTTDPTKNGGWATLGQTEGIWAAGGMVSDGNGVFAVTGNRIGGATPDHMNSDSEQVVRVTGLGVLNRNDQNIFYSSDYVHMDAADQDLGSASPVLIDVPGATPSSFVAVPSKHGHLYLLDPANLGGMGGQKVDFMVAKADNAIHTAPGSYTTAKGRYITLATDASGACPMGGPSGKVVMGVHIPAGSPPKPEVTWCAALTGAVPGPIATSTDGTSNVIVWFMSGSTLMGVDGDTGKAIYTGNGANACSGVEQWTSLIAVKGRIVSASNGTLCSWSSK